MSMGFSVGQYKRNHHCSCGNYHPRDTKYFKLGSVKLCEDCLTAALVAISTETTWQRGGALTWGVKTSTRKVSCKCCGNSLIAGTYHAHAFGQQAFSERYCDICLINMRTYLRQELAKDPVEECVLTTQQIDRLLLEARFGKQKVKIMKELI